MTDDRIPHPSVAFALPYYNRGPGCNFFPGEENLQEPDALERWVLHGWLPEKPFITRDHVVTSFGSCFAAYITDYLAENHYSKSDEGVQPYTMHYAAEIVNTFAVAQQFEWAWEDKEFSEGLWVTREKKPLAMSKAVREATKTRFDKTDVFVITLGLSEIWYNKQTNEVYWRATVRKDFNPDLHGFRVATYQENVENMHIMVKLIKKHRPNASIVFTLSPVPLIATFRPISCLTANTVSKAILRAAVDEIVTTYKMEDNVYYWPAYEIVKEFVEEGFYKQELMHVRRDVVLLIMEAFSKHYLVP